MIHVTQARDQASVRDYLTRRMTKHGQTPRMARRAHKRLLANVIIRHMWRDAHTQAPPTTATTNPRAQAA